MSIEAALDATDANPPAPAERRWARSRWLLVVGFWVTFGVIESAETVLSFRARGQSVSWALSLAYNVPGWLVWAALTPVVIAFCRQVNAAAPAAGRRQWLRFAAHVPFGALVSGVHLLATSVQTYLVLPAEKQKGLFAYAWRLTDDYLVFELLTYAGIVVAYFAWQWHQRYNREREASLRLALRTAELERSLVEARLDALRMELNPHFLFNTLNSVAGLVRRGDSDRAIDVLADLGDLLRATLDGSRRAEVSLGEELALIERYLAIESVRFADRLSVSVDIAPGARTAAVPSMILQPLVENALRHGVGRSPGPGRVVISAGREGERLRLSVADSGPGFGEGAPGGAGGIGLSNTRSRLRTRYGAHAELLVGRSALGGAEVSVCLPFTADARL